jgi:septum formation protein
MPLILASTSPIRIHLLEQAGVEFIALPPSVDEEMIKRGHAGDGPALALRIAEAKAVSLDQPGDRADAARHLAHFSGKQMILSSAVAVARNGVVEWRHVDSAKLDVRILSPEYIEQYLDQEWPDVAYCVGVFRMEGRGATLFGSVEGSHFTILGLPLLPLLGALRERGMAA